MIFLLTFNGLKWNKTKLNNRLVLYGKKYEQGFSLKNRYSLLKGKLNLDWRAKNLKNKKITLTAKLRKANYGCNVYIYYTQ